MNYCLIQNNQITEGPKRLPKSWRNISGLHLLSDDRLKDHGWLPYVDEGPPEYNRDTQTVSRENVIGQDAVTVKYIVTDLPAERIKEIADSKADQEKETLIQQEIRKMVIERLKAQGKLNESGKLVI